MPHAADASDGLEVRRLAGSADAERRAAEAIFLEAFPDSERIPFGELVARDASGANRVDVVSDGAGVVGIAALAPLGVGGWSHLEYIAVAADRRGGGIGAAIWRALMARLRAERDDAAVLLEIENPFAPGLGDAERASRARRQRFYTRLGARLLRAPAVAIPDAADPAAPAIPMLLLAAPGRRAALPADDARRLVSGLYRRAYGLGEDHPVVRRALSSVS